MPSKARRPARSILLRRWLAVGVLVLVALLYYRPIKAYVDARGQLAQKRAAVEQLRQEKLRLQHRLGSSTSLATLAREARALGYVKPGEHLFIVKGINQWRKRERASFGRR
ncbi:MAG TPA: septum formation initiator family protein [Gaiellaceae bacterium]|nr:septum formation initiator family protein [Gaiellaceae bacterium]